jgi:hypothetical protein
MLEYSNIQDRWVSGLSSSSGILSTTKHKYLYPHISMCGFQSHSLSQTKQGPGHSSPNLKFSIIWLLSCPPPAPYASSQYFPKPLRNIMKLLSPHSFNISLPISTHPPFIGIQIFCHYSMNSTRYTSQWTERKKKKAALRIFSMERVWHRTSRCGLCFPRFIWSGGFPCESKEMAGPISWCSQ